MSRASTSITRRERIGRPRRWPGAGGCTRRRSSRHPICCPLAQASNTKWYGQAQKLALAAGNGRGRQMAIRHQRPPARQLQFALRHSRWARCQPKRWPWRCRDPGYGSRSAGYCASSTRITSITRHVLGRQPQLVAQAGAGRGAGGPAGADGARPEASSAAGVLGIERLETLHRRTRPAPGQAEMLAPRVDGLSALPSSSGPPRPLSCDPLPSGSPPYFSSVNRLFLIGSSLTKSHLSRNHQSEETGQVKRSPTSTSRPWLSKEITVTTMWLVCRGFKLIHNRDLHRTA